MPDDLTPEQADGLACVECGASFINNPTPSVPVGRSRTGSQVFACVSCADPSTGGESR